MQDGIKIIGAFSKQLYKLYKCSEGHQTPTSLGNRTPPPKN